eukprot:2776837-Amphidinium_carterae.1
MEELGSGDEVDATVGGQWTPSVPPPWEVQTEEPVHHRMIEIEIEKNTAKPQLQVMNPEDQGGQQPSQCWFVNCAVPKMQKGVLRRVLRGYEGVGVFEG